MKTFLSGQRLWLLALVAGLAAAFPACGDEDGKDFGDCVREDGSIDCSSAHCVQSPQCQRGCDQQIPTCEASLTARPISRICEDGSCADAGPRDGDGEIIRGTLHLRATFAALPSPVVPGLRSFAATVHHSARPGGGTLSCSDLMAMNLMELEDSTASNIVARRVAEHTADAGEISTLEITSIPVTHADESFLVFVRFFTVTTDIHSEPQGEVAGKGCIEDVTVIPGPFVEDPPNPAQSPSIAIQPACSPTDPNACPDGKVCVPLAGMCRYQCEPACTSAGQVCRPKTPGAAPECLRRCYPDTPGASPCPVGDRCDTPLGEEPACLPEG